MPEMDAGFMKSLDAIFCAPCDHEFTTEILNVRSKYPPSWEQPPLPCSRLPCRGLTTRRPFDYPASADCQSATHRVGDLRYTFKTGRMALQPGRGPGASARADSGWLPMARMISFSSISLAIGFPTKPKAPTAAARGRSFSGSPLDTMMYLARG